MEALPVALPLLGGAVLAAGTTRLPRWFADGATVVTAAAVTGLGALLLWRGGDAVSYWFGGWIPRDGVAIGITFVADPLAAGAVVLAGMLVTAAMIFSWRYFDAVGTLFHSLMLVFLAGMTGFALTGDLFTLFVFFELMSVPAYALTGYKIERRAPLQGAVNFAVVNSVGALCILVGVGLIYARTGALNMAQAGRALAGAGPDALLVVAFTLLVTGFLVKSAAVPFHFWLADAYAVAPTPVCVVFSGLMVELGVYAIARVYWSVFSGSLGASEDALRLVLVSAGVAAGVVGAVMCFEQRHLKRLLAFSTVGHGGLFLIGVGLLDPAALGGTAVYVVGHGFVAAALFVCVGIVLHRLGHIDEDDLRGRGRHLPVTGAIFAAAGLALAGLPPFGIASGGDLLGQAAAEQGFGWVRVVIVFVSVFTGGAILRAAGRIFRGWGPDEPETPSEAEARQEAPETRGARGRTPPAMMASAVVLLAAALLTGLVPGLRAGTAEGAELLQDRRAYASTVLEGDQIAVTGRASEPPAGGPATGMATAAGAIGVALLALFRGRLPPPARSVPWRVWRPALVTLRSVHSGHVGDYVTWLMVGLAILGGAFATTLRG